MEFVHLRKPHVERKICKQGLDDVSALEVSKHIIFTCLGNIFFFLYRIDVDLMKS